MLTYKFCDTDEYGKESFDITGNEYIELLNTCFKYAYSISVLIPIEAAKHMPYLADIEPYRLPVSKSIANLYQSHGIYSIVSNDLNNESPYEIRHYKLSEDVKKVIFGITDSIFKWIYGWGYNNPEDPAFIRSDGSVFFASIIHDGICTITAFENEDISAVISNKNWVSVN